VKKLDIAHHKVIMLCFVLVAFITGIFLGVKVAEITQETSSMMVIVFALSFLSIIMLFLIFTQIVHLEDTLGRKKK